MTLSAGALEALAVADFPTTCWLSAVDQLYGMLHFCLPANVYALLNHHSIPLPESAKRAGWDKHRRACGGARSLDAVLASTHNPDRRARGFDAISSDNAGSDCLARLIDGYGQFQKEMGFQIFIANVRTPECDL